MMNRGIWAIATMFCLGLILAGGSVLYHFAKGRKSLAFWGAADAQIIRHAPHVTLLKLGPAPDGSTASAPDAAVEEGDSPTPVADAKASLLIDDVPHAIERELSIDQARGLVHARHALIIDANYNWPATQTIADQPAARWTHALRFEKGERSVTLLFDFEQSRIRRLEPNKEAILQPTIAAAEKALVERELAAASVEKAPSHSQ